MRDKTIYELSHGGFLRFLIFYFVTNLRLIKNPLELLLGGGGAIPLKMRVKKYTCITVSV
jgi:hypothetical protein